MNTRPAESGVGQCNPLDSGDAASPNAGAIRISGNQAFIVQARLKNPSGLGFALKPSEGPNQYSIRLVRVDGMAPSSKNAQVQAEYWRFNPNDPDHPVKKNPATVQVEDDGSFTASVEFKRRGNWKVGLHVTDSDLKDDVVIDQNF